MKFVLIFLALVGERSINTVAEFGTEQACMAALTELSAYADERVTSYNMLVGKMDSWSRGHVLFAKCVPYGEDDVAQESKE